jgi:hypothetical protein
LIGKDSPPWRGGRAERFKAAVLKTVEVVFSTADYWVVLAFQP